MKFTLPMPPSSNRYWRSFRGNVCLSAEAKQYKKQVAFDFWRKGVKPFSGPVSVSLDVYRARKSGDLDNRLKVCLDSLQGIAFENDSQIVEIHARRFEDKLDPRVEVEVTEL